MRALDGKKADSVPGWIAVVAAALCRADGRWLMHRRPEGKHHAGLWEFPGGKVEASEMPKESLVRELSEEIGIACRAGDLCPAAFAESEGEASARGLVILLYTLAAWEGDPQALEGGAVGWFTPEEICRLPKPPLDIQLAAGLFANREICRHSPLPRPNDPPKSAPPRAHP